jgi:RimJ/RimL family protein N-acetyltransferase
MDTPTLQTPRFTLRPLGPDDVAPLYPTFADEAVMRYWSCPPFASEAALAEWLLAPGWGGRAWVPVPNDGGDADRVAWGRFVAVPRLDGVIELGWIVAKDRAGQGVARECVAALITHLFRAEGLRRIYADVDPDNAPSNRLAQSLGMTLEGRMRANWETHIGVRDSLIWGLLREEWAG